MAAPLSLPRGPCSSRQRAPQPREWVQPGRLSELTHLFGVLSRHVHPWLPPRGTSCISSLLFQTAVFSLYLKSSREQKKKKKIPNKKREIFPRLDYTPKWLQPPTGTGLGWAGPKLGEPGALWGSPTWVGDEGPQDLGQPLLSHFPPGVSRQRPLAPGACPQQGVTHGMRLTTHHVPCPILSPGVPVPSSPEQLLVGISDPSSWEKACQGLGEGGSRHLACSLSRPHG